MIVPTLIVKLYYSTNTRLYSFIKKMDGKTEQFCILKRRQVDEADMINIRERPALDFIIRQELMKLPTSNHNIDFTMKELNDKEMRNILKIYRKVKQFR